MMDEMKGMNMLLTFALGRDKKAKKYYEKCSECGKLLNKTSMKKHVLTHKPQSEWPWSCALCQKRMQTQHDMIKHLRSKVHENDRVPMEGTEKWYELINHDRTGLGYVPFAKKQRSFSNDQPNIENDLKDSILNALYSDIPKSYVNEVSYDSKLEWDSPQEESFNCTEFSQPLDLSKSSLSLKSDSKLSDSLSSSKSVDENKNNILSTPASPTSSSSSAERCRNLRVRITKLEIDPIIIEFIKENQMQPYKSEDISFGSPKKNSLESQPDSSFNSQQENSFDSQKENSFDSQQEISFDSQKENSFDSQQEISFDSQQEISFDSQQEISFDSQQGTAYSSEQENTYNSEQENIYNSEQDITDNSETDMSCTYEQEIPFKSMQENSHAEIPIYPMHFPYY